MDNTIHLLKSVLPALNEAVCYAEVVASGR